MSTRKSSPTSPLTRERIVETALAIVDGHGLKALSMRRLGAELGVDPMAVYHHVPNKDALLDGIVEAVMSGIDPDIDDPTASPEDRLLAAARAYRDALVEHLPALPLLLERGPRTAASMRPVETLVGILRDAGLSPQQAVAGMNAVASTVRGYVAAVADTGPVELTQEQIQAMYAELPPNEFPNLYAAQLSEVDFLGADFDFGIRALARGLLGAEAD